MLWELCRVMKLFAEKFLRILPRKAKRWVWQINEIEVSLSLAEQYSVSKSDKLIQKDIFFSFCSYSYNEKGGAKYNSIILQQSMHTCTAWYPHCDHWFYVCKSLV